MRDFFIFVRLASNKERRLMHGKIVCVGAFVVGYFGEAEILKSNHF